MPTDAHEPSSAKRSNSRTRPTTPLRPSSRSSFRDSARGAGTADAHFPLNTFEPAFAELSDAMADLEANMMHFQLMHESLARFSESFASFLYGLNMNAFCVDFPEVRPVAQARERISALTTSSSLRRPQFPSPFAETVSSTKLRPAPLNDPKTTQKRPSCRSSCSLLRQLNTISPNQRTGLPTRPL